jgi:hypothetical protein
LVIEDPSVDVFISARDFRSLAKENRPEGQQTSNSNADPPAL